MSDCISIPYLQILSYKDYGNTHSIWVKSRGYINYYWYFYINILSNTYKQDIKSKSTNFLTCHTQSSSKTKYRQLSCQKQSHLHTTIVVQPIMSWRKGLIVHIFELSLVYFLLHLLILLPLILRLKMVHLCCEFARLLIPGHICTSFIVLIDGLSVCHSDCGWWLVRIGVADLRHAYISNRWAWGIAEQGQ